MATYFGACDSSGNPSGSGNNTDAQICFWRAYTCPGSGNQTVKELSADVHPTLNSPLLRLAIYNSSGTTKIAEGTGAISISGTSDSWQGHMTQAAINPNPCTLVGGTDYILAIAFGYSSYAETTSDHVDGTRSNGNYKAIDYTAGFPASLPTPDSTWAMYPPRCGVDAASTDVTVTATETLGLSEGKAIIPSGLSIFGTETFGISESLD